MRDHQRNHGSLDLAATAGWSVGIPFSIPESGSWDLKGITRAERYLALRSKLVPWFIKYDLSVCFIEEPLDPNFAIKVGVTRDVTMALNGYVAIAELLCAQYQVRSILVERTQALMHFTGRKSYKEKDGAKKACVARCHQLKYPIDGYDAADAAAQWDFGCARLYAQVYATVKSNLPVTLKGYDRDANFPGTRGFSRRRPRRSGRNPTLFDGGSD